MAASNGLTSVEELSATFDVTPSTIRRDLAKLTAQGKLARTYGGVMSLAHHPEASLRQRLGEAHAAKRDIARWAADQIEPGETILLDAGSTMGALADAITKMPELNELTVVTAGISAMGTLTDSVGIDVHGALPADTLFFLAGRGDYDLVVAMYHDQGHGPVKVLGLEAGVNVTIGLPVIRTSVDHGTAFDIAGTGVADHRSMIEALRLGAEMAPRPSDA